MENGFFKRTLDLEGIEDTMNSEYYRKVLIEDLFHIVEDYIEDI